VEVAACRDTKNAMVMEVDVEEAAWSEYIERHIVHIY
jgi:hypothetical protein